MKIHQRLFLALILGASAGLLLHGTDISWLPAINNNLLQPIGQIFLRLIFMTVVPLVFSSLVVGVYELGKSRGLGVVAGKTLLYTVLASACSVLIGIVLVDTLQPGRGFSPPMAIDSAAVGKITENAGKAKSFAQSFVELIPKNPLDAAAHALDGEMLSLMLFALFFGVALSLLAKNGQGSKQNPVIALLEQIFAASMKIVDVAMKLAPFAVFVLVFNSAYQFGHAVLLSLMWYAAVVVLGLLIQQFVVYPILLKSIARRSPWEFFKACREVFLYAFSTASSNATLPRTLDTAENKLGLPKEISRFVLTVGATANQNGTALFEGVTVLFLAQVYGIDLSFAQQLQVVVMSIIAGIGTAGVPGGSLPLIVLVLQSVGIPAEGIGLILGVDRFLDMCRTTLNVSGDLVIAAMVSRQRGS